MRVPFGKFDRGKTYISDKLSSLYKQYNLSQGELSCTIHLRMKSLAQRSKYWEEHYRAGCLRGQIKSTSYASVAQLVEPTTDNRVVTGPSPVICTIRA